MKNCKSRLRVVLGLGLIPLVLFVGCGKSSSDPAPAADTTTTTLKAKTAATLTATFGTLQIAADAFPDGTVVSLIEGKSLQSDTEIATLVPAANVTAAGTTALIASVVKQNAALPMVLTVPLPSGTTLADANASSSGTGTDTTVTNTKKILVVYKYLNYAEKPVRIEYGYWTTDKFTEQGITVNADGTVSFKTVFLGAYQLVVTKEAINQSVNQISESTTILDANKKDPFTTTALQLKGLSRFAAFLKNPFQRTSVLR